MTQPGTELADLLADRSIACRRGLPPLSSVTELTSWIDERGVVLVSGKSALPNAAEAIAGRAIGGSWWGDPEGSLIYRLLNELEDRAGDYLDLVLVEGKRTLIAPHLTPIVRAVASDPERRRRATDALKEPARPLLGLLAGGRTVRSDDQAHSGTAERTARAALEARLLARSTSVHTMSGHHASVLEAYGEHAVNEQRATGGLRELLEASLASAVVAEQGEVDKWFRFVEPDRGARSAAIEALGTRQIRANGRIWLTLDN